MRPGVSCHARLGVHLDWTKGISALLRVDTAPEGPLIRTFRATFSPRGEGTRGALVLIIGPALRPLSPSGRGREAMTYGRELSANRKRALDGAVVSHSAELVRGDLLHFLGRPLAAGVADGR